MVVSHGMVCFVQQAHNTNSGNKRRTLYLQEASDDGDVGKQVVAATIAGSPVAVVGEAGDRQALAGTNW